MPRTMLNSAVPGMLEHSTFHLTTSYRVGYTELPRKDLNQQEEETIYYLKNYVPRYKQNFEIFRTCYLTVCFRNFQYLPPYFSLQRYLLKVNKCYLGKYFVYSIA